jgi:hypothetical protein
MTVDGVLVLRGSQDQCYLRFLTMGFVNTADELCLQGVKNQSQISPRTK